MAFLDKKERVIQLQMTPYGRYLYSTGGFKPVYYEFYDDDVVYDIRYGNTGSIGVVVAADEDGLGRAVHGPQIKEPQNEIIPRIKRDLYTDVAHSFSNLEEDGKIITSTHQKEEWCAPEIENQPEILTADQLFSDKEYSMGLSLGTADHNNPNAPAWDVRFLKGTMNQFEKNLDISNQIKIPQIHADLVLERYEGPGGPLIRPASMLLEVDEKNSVGSVEDQFEVELYLEKGLIPLKKFQLGASARATIYLSGTYGSAMSGAAHHGHVGSKPNGDYNEAPYFPGTIGVPGGFASVKSSAKSAEAAGAHSKGISLPTGQFLTTSASLLAKNAFNAKLAADGPKGIKLSAITPMEMMSVWLQNKIENGFSGRRIYAVHPGFEPLLADVLDINLGDYDKLPSMGYGFSQKLPAWAPIGDTAPSSVKGTWSTKPENYGAYWFYTGGSIEDATKNLCAAINMRTNRDLYREENPKFSWTVTGNGLDQEGIILSYDTAPLLRPYYATYTVSDTGTNGTTTWRAQTGSITIHTAEVGKWTNDYPQAVGSNYSIEMVNATGSTAYAFAGGHSPGKNYTWPPRATAGESLSINGSESGGVAEGYGPPGSAPLMDQPSGEDYLPIDHELSEKESLKLAKLISWIRLEHPDYSTLGTKENWQEFNQKLLRDKVPWLFKEEQIEYEKYYFSDSAQTSKSKKFANFYFEIDCDSEIEKEDFCNAKTFDQEKTLYVSGHIRCTPNKIEKIDLYDQTDEDYGDPC
jgi:hypothetical protein